MVFFKLDAPQQVIDTLPEKMLEQGVKINGIEDGEFRFVTTNDTSREDIDRALADLLNDRLTAPTEFNCIEPDFNFILNPKKDLRLDPKVLYVRPGCEIVDIDMEWKISFLDEGLTDNYLSVSLVRSDIECLLSYLRLVMGEVQESAPEIKALMNKGVVYRNDMDDA